MKYYILRTESDPKVIGVKNGVTQVEIIENEHTKDQYKKIMDFFDYFSYWSKDSFVPDDNYKIEYVQLLKNAILTDFLMFNPSLMGCPFMISDKAKGVFQNFSLPEHYYFPVKIFDKGELVSDRYHLMYCPYIDYDVVDFAKSLFFTGNNLLGKKFYQFEEKSEYLNFLTKTPLLRSEKIVLNKLFDKNLDFFNPRFGELYVSEELKEAIKGAYLTGAKVLDATEPVLVIESNI